MAHQTTSVDRRRAANAGPEARARETAAGLTADRVWHEIEKASFAVLSHITPDSEPRSSGVVYGVKDRRLYVVVATDSWKARQIRDGQRVALTVPVRRGGPLSLMAQIPPATISFHARTLLHPPGTLEIGSLSKDLAALLPKEGQPAVVLELIPEGEFLTYGIGVSLMAMRNPAAARARVPIDSPARTEVSR